MNRREIFESNLLESGYGNKEKLSKVLDKLTEEDIEVLSYSCYRASEKIGVDAFESAFLVGQDKYMLDD